MTTAIILCCVAFLIGVVAGSRSLAAGLGAVLGVGYSYGILRANVPQALSHFVFDAAVLGLYIAQLPKAIAGDASNPAARTLVSWVAVLVAWPAVLFLMPIQHPLVQLVGLRGNIFFLPFLLLGARLTWDDAYSLALWLAGLNLLAFGLAVAEYLLGLERFYPKNEVTKLVYQSLMSDLKSHRIPACFVTSHVYGEAMVASVPWFIGAWSHPRRKAWHNPLLMLALPATALGVFFSASRMAAAMLLVLFAGLVFTKRLGPKAWLGLFAVLLVVGYFVAKDRRLQRFTELENTDYVGTRVHGSVNFSLLKALIDHPVGNGLGGGGTSIPHFLQHHIRDVVVFENEYARIAMEQGLPGLLLWVAFICWVLTRPVSPHGPWGSARWLIRLRSVILFASGLIGIGLMTAIPGTAMWCLGAGWIAVAQPPGPLRRIAPRPARAA